jgi:hypothetical protein
MIVCSLKPMGALRLDQTNFSPFRHQAEPKHASKPFTTRSSTTGLLEKLICCKNLARIASYLANVGLGA